MRLAPTRHPAWLLAGRVLCAAVAFAAPLGGCGTTVNPADSNASAGSGSGGAPSGVGGVSTGVGGADPSVIEGYTALDSTAVLAASAVAPDGSLYVALNYSEGASFLGEPLPTASAFGGAVAKLDGAGSLAWLKAIPGAYGMAGIALAPNGDLVLCGGPTGDTDLGGGELKSKGIYGDAFVARYRSTRTATTPSSPYTPPAASRAGWHASEASSTTPPAT